MASIRNGIKMLAFNPSVFSAQLSIYLGSKPKLLPWHFCVCLDPEGGSRAGWSDAPVGKRHRSQYGFKYFQRFTERGLICLLIYFSPHNRKQKKKIPKTVL